MVGDTTPRRYRIVIDTLAVLTATALLLSGWALYSRFGETNSRRAENARVWHAVICSIEQAVVADRTRHYPDGEKTIILKFYDGLLTNDVHTTGCGLIPKEDK